MDPFLSALQSAFDLTPRKGWIMFLFGVVMITLMKMGTVPAADTQPGWFTLFVALAVLGAIILVVHLAVWMIGNSRSYSARAAEQTAISQKNRLFLEEGVRNLDIAGPAELEALAWILKRGKRRFSGTPLSADGSAGLVDKKILHRDTGTSAENVWMVNELVWEKRDEILRQHGHRSVQPNPPWDRW